MTLVTPPLNGRPGPGIVSPILQVNTSIRWRLTVWYATVLAVTLMVLGSATFLLMRAALYDWLDDAVRDRAASLAARVALAGPGSRPYLLDRRLGTYEEAADGVLLLDGLGRTVGAWHISPHGLISSAAVEAALHGAPGVSAAPADTPESVRVGACPTLSGGKVAAVVVVARDLKELNQVLARLAAVLIGLLPVAVCGAGLVGFTMANRALAPVDEITRTAAEISEEDLSRRLPVRTADELGRLASTFNSLIGRLESAFDRQQRFTADASHELRTPLSIIRAITSQKLMQPRSVEEYQSALRHIDEASVYMARLVNHLLILARADAGQLSLDQEYLDLSDLLQQVAAQVEESTGRTITVTAPAPVMVRGDSIRLTGLFLNLLENADKYTPSDGQVAVTVRTIGGEAIAAVHDTGIGISEEHLPHIFERFYRVDRARSRGQGGTGLGLAIGKWVAEAHGGSIRCESGTGRGATITVTLPLADPGFGGDPAAPGDSRTPAPGSSGSSDGWLP